MYRLWLLLAAVVPLNAAALRTRSFEIPNAFEANLGQSPARFQYLATHRNIGFSCLGIHWGKMFSSRQGVVLFDIRIDGAVLGCASELREEDGSHSFYYRGRNAAGSIGPVPRFKRLRIPLLRGVVEYTGERDKILANFTLPDAAALRSLRLLWNQPGRTGGGGDTIITALGVWKVSSSRGTARAVWTADSQTVSFTFDDAGNPNVPVTLILEMPTDASPSVTATTDADGSLYASGSTVGYSQFATAGGFCRLGAFPERCPDVFLVKFDAASQVKYLVYLLGDNMDRVTHVVAGPDGNVYAGGYTYSPDFVTTAGVVQQQYAGPFTQALPLLNFGGDVFLAKLDGASGRLLYATYLGLEHGENLSSLQVDGLSRTYLRVESMSREFPAWGNPLIGEFTCYRPGFVPGEACSFLVSLDSQGAEVRYSKRVGPTPRVTATGVAYLASQRISADGELESVLEIPDGLQGVSLGIDTGVDGTIWMAGFGVDGTTLSRLRPDGLGWEIVREGLPPIASFRAGRDGYLWMMTREIGAGDAAPFTPTPDAPLVFPCDKCRGLIRLSLDGAMLFATYLPAETRLARWVDSTLLWVEGSATAYSIDLDAPAAPLIVSVEDTSAHVAEYLAGNVLTVFGTAIGPGEPAVNPRNSDGSAAMETGGVRVLVDGRPSPILAADRNRITFMLSHQTPSFGSTMMVIEHAGKPVVTAPVTLGGRGFAILTGPYAPPGTGIFNEDGALNSRENPAPPGSVIRFYFVATGPCNPPLVDGQTNHLVLAKPVAPVRVHLGLGLPAELLSLAQAPGELAGYIEARVRIPASLPAGSETNMALPIIPFVTDVPILHAWNHPVYVGRVQP